MEAQERLLNEKKYQEIIINFNRNYIIGRSDKVEIQINDDSISRKHAEICVLEDSATIKDLGSANGTFVDEKAAKGNQLLFLKNGVKIHIGDSPNYLKVKERKSKDVDETIEEEEKPKENKKNKTSKEEENHEDEQEQEQNVKVKKSKKEGEKKNQERERSRSYEKTKCESVQKDSKQQQVEQKSFGSVGKELDAKEKRKLLWSNKKTDNLESKAQIYGKVEANQEETNKFFKLLGFKQSVEGKSVSAGPQNFFIKKSGLEKQTMNNDLENQFNEGIKRKSGGKNGLGFN